MALQTLKISGKVITTHYSFVVTTNALHWNGIKPVFVGIESEYCNLDADKIEAVITHQAIAIFAVK